MKQLWVNLCTLTFVLLTTINVMAQSDQNNKVNRIEEGNLVMENIPEIPEQIVQRMRQYQNSRSASLSGWLHGDKGMLISTRFGETSQLHIVEKVGGARKQVTFFNEPVGYGSFCPDKNRNGFLFSKDIGGGENYQIFYFNLDDGNYQMVSDGKSRNNMNGWSNKGDRFVFTSNKRNGKDSDIYIANIDQPTEAKMVYEAKGLWYVADWSPDDTQLLIGNYVSANESHYHILDIATGKSEKVNPSEEKISYGGGMWSKDGKGIFLTSDENSEFRSLKYYNIAEKTFTNITKDIPWDVSLRGKSNDRTQMAFIANAGGRSELYLLNPETFAYTLVPDIPVGQVYSIRFHPDGQKMAMVINTDQTAGDIYVRDLKTNTQERWTYSEVGGLETERFIKTQLIEYETFDEVEGKKRKIPAFYYKPAKATKENPAPVLISIHGGPEGQARPYFSPQIQYFTNELGIAYIRPNVRGSSGYGKSYLKLDNGYKREDSVKDIGALLDWIAQQPELDASRVAVMGGSYGGYMVLASMVHYNDRLSCGIDMVGISNFVTFLENTKEYRRDLRRVEYGDERDPKMREFLNQISPNNHADKITKPMLIAQGLNDPRVPASEAEQMVAAIRKNKGDVWYLLAKDEGHGFRKKSNRDFYSHVKVLFLKKYLLGE